jgi:CDP-paratose 2-epimerase
MSAHGSPRKRPVLITGGAGFIGSNLADRLAQEGCDILVFDALARAGVEANLAWLKRKHPSRISSVIADIRDGAAVEAAVRDAEAVFHLAAQVAVTTSMAEPRRDFEVNVGGTLAVLEAARRCPVPPPVIFASTNKVYGDLADIALVEANGAYAPRDALLRARGVGEDRALDFHTPYGCSKGAADQYVLDYARSFGLATAVLRMSCIYGPRQMGTEDQGWVAHFLLRALRGEPIVVYGDGKQVRDVLNVADAVSAYVALWRGLSGFSGRAFNLGGGPRNAVSLLQVLREIEALLGRSVDVRFERWRPGDQRYFVADTRRISAALGLAEPTPWRRGLRQLGDWLARAQSAAQESRVEAVAAEIAS